MSRSRNTHFLAGFASCLLAAGLSAQETTPKPKKIFIDADGEGFYYRLVVPPASGARTAGDRNSRPGAPGIPIPAELRYYRFTETEMDIPFDLRDTLVGLNIPLLVVWGDADAVVPVAHVQEAKDAPQSRLEVFAGSGHCPHIERADVFNQLALTFLVG